MKTLILFCLLAVTTMPACATTWEVPPNEWVELSAPEDCLPTQGVINPNEEASIGWAAYSDATTSTESTTFGPWHMPGCTYYYPDGGPLAHPDGDMKISHSQGMGWVEAGNFPYQLTSASSRIYPAYASWFRSGAAFSFPFVLQKGDQNPYADGVYTIARKGCCACCWLMASIWQEGCPWTIEQFNDEMNAHGGYSGRSVRFNVAGKLLNLVCIGRFKASSLAGSKSLIEKYEARGWSVIVRLHHPGQHWVEKRPGEVIKSNDTIINLMADPAGRYETFESATKYKVDQIVVLAPKTWVWGISPMRPIPYQWLVRKWWKNPKWPSVPHWMATQTNGAVVSSAQSVPQQFWWSNIGRKDGLFPKTALAATPASDSWFSDTVPATISTGYAALDAASNQGIFIERVSGPTFDLGQGVSADDKVSLFNDYTENESEHNDELEIDEIAPIPPDQPDDHSLCLATDAKTGTYRYHLTGSPGAAYTVTIGLTYDNGETGEVVLRGNLGLDGKAVASYDFDPGITVLSLGAMRKMSAGQTIATASFQVTARDDTGFFIEADDRSSGARVQSLALPEVGQYVSLSGKLISASPEITIAANSIEVDSTETPVEIKPLGMPGKWPEMANCLLAKICGKVISIDGTTVTITNGTTDVTIAGVNQAPMIGSFISAVGILRTGNILELKPDSMVVLEPN